MTYPKIELHVHLEATVRPATLLAIARRNGVDIGAETEQDVAKLYEYRDFKHFLQVWMRTTPALRTEQDFREVVLGYAEQAAAQGAVYLEGIFSPAEPAGRGVRWEEVFAGYCDGAQEAEEKYGVRIRLTLDIPRNYPIEAAELTVKHGIAHRDRSVVAVGLGGSEADYPPAPFAEVFAAARDGGLGSVPHAGEAAGPESIRDALDLLGADRIRHGIRAVEDPALLSELVRRRIVLDVCPISNLRTGVVRTLAEHPLPRLIAAGALCTINTDDPVMFGTDLETEHRAALSLGVTPRSAYEAGVAGALCDEATRNSLRNLGDQYPWS